MKIISYTWRLTAASVLAAGLLASVFQLTAAPIKANAARQKEQRIRSLLPPETTEIRECRQDGFVFFQGLVAGQPCGAVLEGAADGYGGRITVLVGLDAQGAIRELAIAEHNETPGLGAKITGPEFRGQFRGRGLGALALSKEQAGGIDGIAAATISSRAVLTAAQQALTRYTEVPDVR